MGAFLSFLPLIQTALGVLGQFKGSAAEAKATGYVQDAVGVIKALVPLVDQVSSGQEVTADDVRVALAAIPTALAEFDALIAQKGG